MELESLIDNNGKNTEELVYRCHAELLSKYPGIRLRWSRIYGKRWSHFLGNVWELAFFPVRLELNSKYGLSIENPELISEPELSHIINQLKGVFA